MKRFTVYVLIVLFTLSSLAFSSQASLTVPQTIDEQALDEFIHAIMQRHNIPGVAVAVTRGDETLYLKGFGQASPEARMTPDTPMLIGSLSKSFTALAIMQLAEQGKLDIDQPVVEVLPTFRIADPQASRTITIRNLLNHASGLSDFSYLPSHADEVSIQDSVGYLRDAELTAPVGGVFQYFNSNYAILGAIVEKVSGMPYDLYISNHIFQPLGMDNSYADFEKATSAGLPVGYGNFFGFSIRREQPLRAYDLPAGYLMMSVRDLSRYLRAQLHGGALDGSQILSSEAIETTHTPQKNLDVPYGMGWFIHDQLGMRIIEHGGTNENFHTLGALLPDRDMTIAILTNKNSIFHALYGNQRLNDGVIAIASGLPAPHAGFSIRLLGALMLAGFLVNVAFSLRSFFRLNQWLGNFTQKKPAGKVWDVASHFVIPALLLLFLPIGISAFLQRGFSWEMAWSQAPDGVFWLFTGFLFDLALGMIKTVLLLKHRRV